MDDGRLRGRIASRCTIRLSAVAGKSEMHLISHQPISISRFRDLQARLGPVLVLSASREPPTLTEVYTFAR